MKNLILLVSTFFLLISCVYTNTDDSHKLITIVNKSNKTLYVFRSYEYPNVEAYKHNPDPMLGGDSKVESHETTQSVLASGTSYEHIYENSIPSGTMMIYVFDGATLESQGWDYIKANNLVLKRYDLTLQDLQNMNWTITYDGN